MTPRTPTTPHRSLEIVPLADRLRWLLTVRLVVLLGPVVAWAAIGDRRPAPLELLLVPGAVLLVVALVLHGLSRLGHRWAVLAISVPLILDGVHLGWAFYLTGGTSSPVVHLIAGHVLAVTLLGSFRTGMKVAFWHSLVVMTVLKAVGTGLLPPQHGVAGFDEMEFSGFLAVVWMTAVTTAALAAVNERELRRRRYDEEVLRRSAVALHEASTHAELSTALLEFTVDAADSPVAAVFCHVPGHDGAPATGLTARVRHGEGMEALRTVAAPSGGSLLAAASSRGMTVLAEMDGSDAWVDEVLDGASRVVAVPFALHGQVSGVLAFAQRSRRGRRVEQRRVSLVEQAVAHAATAFARIALLDQLHASAHTDGLTGVANRRAFDAALDREIAAAAGTDSPLSVLLVDLDHFKRFNDDHGHAAGDDVLRAVGAVLRSCVRHGDVVARFGGEEFAMVLPGGTAADALAAAGRLRDLLRLVDAPRPVTASVGIACWPDHGLTAEDLLAAADVALYAAKDGGRDQARLAGVGVGVGGDPTGAAGGPVAAEDVDPARLAVTSSSACTPVS